MPDDPLVGHQLANFRIERVIGRGGMAQVYYGQDVVLQRPVAVKVIDMRFRGNVAYAQRFVREAQMVATWRHENILQVYYAAQENDLYYFVMEYVDGLDLGRLLEQSARENKLLPQAQVIRIGWAIANALDYAHQKGVIHRDVKPSNVMVAHDGRVVLADFGIALDVQQGSFGEVGGSPRYLAPEQARHSGEALFQSDLYSLGVILYEMLTGRVPFDDPSPLSVSLQHLTQPPPAPRQLNSALNAETEAVLLKALAKSAAQRYRTGGELMNALERALFSKAEVTQRGTPVERAGAPPAPLASPAGKQPDAQRRKSFLWLTLAGLLLVIIASIAGSLLFTRPANRGLVQLTDTTTVTRVAGLMPTQINTSVPSATLAATRTPTKIAATTTTKASAVTPTVARPLGRRFMLYYDDNSFYIFNGSDSDSVVAPLAFERLDVAGTPVNRADGWRWAQYYPTVKSGWCIRAEILGSASYLRPSQCGNRYNSIITPVREDDFIFWTTQPGSRQFRVLWNNKEVGRCEIAGKVCQVMLP